MLRTFLSFLLPLLFIALPAAAQSKSKTVRDLEKQRKEALQQIEKTDKQLTEVKTDRAKKQKKEKLLKQQVRQRQRALNLLDAEIKALGRDIDSLSSVELALREEEGDHKKAYERSVVALQQRKNSTDQLVFVIISKDFDQAIRRMRFISEYARAHEKAAENLRQTREAIAATQADIETNKKSKSGLVLTRGKEKEKLEAQQRKTGKEVVSLQGKEKELQQQRQKYQQRANALNKKIEEQIAFEIAEAERKAAIPGKGKEVRKAASKGGYAMTAEERKLSGSFASNKGNLLIPVSGTYSVVSRFGVQQHKEASRVQTNNAGIDISVPQGATARAVFDGTVSKIFVLPGYQTSIIVRHGNYLTVYANLTKVRVKAGQKVKAGQILGTVASDEQNTILHFQVWHERTKQNPELWIR